MFNSKLSNVRDDGKFYEMPTGKLIGFDTETTGIWGPPLTCACPIIKLNEVVYLFVIVQE